MTSCRRLAFCRAHAFFVRFGPVFFFVYLCLLIHKDNMESCLLGHARVRRYVRTYVGERARRVVTNELYVQFVSLCPPVEFRSVRRNPSHRSRAARGSVRLVGTRERIHSCPRFLPLQSSRTVYVQQLRHARTHRSGESLIFNHNCSHSFSVYSIGLDIHCTSTCIALLCVDSRPFDQTDWNGWKLARQSKRIRISNHSQNERSF